MAENSKIADNEKIYDKKIRPLMDQIIAICKAHQIPMVATFEYAPEMACTSLLLPAVASLALFRAAQCIASPAEIVAGVKAARESRT